MRRTASSARVSRHMFLVIMVKFREIGDGTLNQNNVYLKNNYKFGQNTYCRDSFSNLASVTEGHNIFSSTLP